MFNELFHVYRLYDGDEEIIDSGIFAVRNNKLTGQLALEENNVRYLSKQGSKLYSVKVDIEYIRYVDDMTFFSDSMETIYEELPLIQRVLNKYRLRINSNKTSGEKSEIKAILTLFKKAIDRGKLVMPEDSMIHLEQYIAAYMLQLACTEPVFASRCYRVIISLLNLCEGKETYDEIIKEINAKNIHINGTYQDSILQVWHYYVLSKYDSNINIERVIDAFASDEVNPIIIAGFIKEGFGNNKKHNWWNKWRKKTIFSGKALLCKRGDLFG